MAFCIAAFGGFQGDISTADGALGLNMSDRQAGLAADDLDVAVSFVLGVDRGCAGLGLGVQILDGGGL